MKRLTGILFLSLYILAFTECHQLLKVPFMMEHFKKHRLMEPGMSFMKFIRIHYLEPVVITDDFQQDQQLPFRSVDCQMMNMTGYVYEPITLELEPPLETSAKFHCYDEINKPQFSSFDIFQPPRFA